MLIIVCTDVELGIPRLSSRQICYQVGTKIHIYIIFLDILGYLWLIFFIHALHIKLIYHCCSMCLYEVITKSHEYGLISREHIATHTNLILSYIPVALVL